MSLQNYQILENLGKLPDTRESKKISFPTFFNGFLFSSTAYCFLQNLSNFLEGFPLSSKAFRFPWRLSAFLIGFLLSLAAFRFPQRLSVEGGFSFPFLFLIKNFKIFPISHKWELNNVERFYIHDCLLKSRNKNLDCSKFVGQLNNQNMCCHECLSDSSMLLVVA